MACRCSIMPVIWLTGFSQLRRLDLTGTCFLQQIVVDSPLPRLTSLNLRECRSIHDWKACLNAWVPLNCTSHAWQLFCRFSRGLIILVLGLKGLVFSLSALLLCSLIKST